MTGTTSRESSYRWIILIYHVVLFLAWWNCCTPLFKEEEEWPPVTSGEWVMVLQTECNIDWLRVTNECLGQEPMVSPIINFHTIEFHGTYMFHHKPEDQFNIHKQSAKGPMQTTCLSSQCKCKCPLFHDHYEQILTFSEKDRHVDALYIEISCLWQHRLLLCEFVIWK